MAGLSGLVAAANFLNVPTSGTSSIADRSFNAIVLYVPDRTSMKGLGGQLLVASGTAQKPYLMASLRKPTQSHSFPSCCISGQKTIAKLIINNRSIVAVPTPLKNNPLKGNCCLHFTGLHSYAVLFQAAIIKKRTARYSGVTF